MLLFAARAFFPVCVFLLLKLACAHLAAFSHTHPHPAAHHTQPHDNFSIRGQLGSWSWMLRCKQIVSLFVLLGNNSL
jgi:hypothetical protein